MQFDVLLHQRRIHGGRTGQDPPPPPPMFKTYKIIGQIEIGYVYLI